MPSIPPSSPSLAADPAPAETLRDRMTRGELRASLSLASIFALRMLGLFLILPVFAEFARTLPDGHDAQRVGLAMGIYGLMQAFLHTPLGGLSDRVGRKPLLVVFTVATLVTAYPAVSWLVAAPSFQRLLMVELWLSFLYASYNGAMVVTLAEVMPPAVRTAGFSLWATLVSGGDDVFAQAMPERLVYVMGAEQSGMDRALASRCDARVSIPSSGAVESLNVAAATAVLLAAWASR